MAIYMQVPQIPGSVSTQGYKDCIELKDIHFNAKRGLNNHIGDRNNREAGIPFIGEIELRKSPDKSSSLLLNTMLKGTSLDKVVITACKGSNPIKPYVTYTLYDVLISQYEENLVTTSDAHGSEYLRLNFNKVEKKFIPHDGTGTPQAPISTGYDLTTAQVL